MTPYWILFFYSAYWGLTQLRLSTATPNYNQWGGGWWAMFILLSILIGFRDEVGGDWETYLNHLDMAIGESIEDALHFSDPAYALLNWLGGKWGGVYFVNTVCAAIFSWGLIEFCRAQPFPWLALVSAIPYLVIVVAMGYTRQSVAIGLAMLALVALGKGNSSRFVFWVLCAALFHKSAVILAPLAVLAGSKRRLLMLVWLLIVSAAMFILLLQESIDNLRYGYLENEYQSSGAGIRIAMNVFPAFIFLAFRGRFDLSPENRSFWSWMSWGAILFVLFLYVSPSSTAVDRVALYWIPIQLFVWSRIPLLLTQNSKKYFMGAFLVVSYSGAVQFVWLFFAQTAFAWLPYKSYLIKAIDVL